MANHIELPEGFTALRVKRGEHVFDFAVPDEHVQRVIEEVGAELLTDEGLAYERAIRDSQNDPLMIGDKTIAELIASAMPAPHLKRFEYADRPLLDLGPVPRPVQRPSTHWGTKIHRADPKRKKKRKAQRLARRRNRR